MRRIGERRPGIGRRIINYFRQKRDELLLDAIMGQHIHASENDRRPRMGPEPQNVHVMAGRATRSKGPGVDKGWKDYVNDRFGFRPEHRLGSEKLMDIRITHDYEKSKFDPKGAAAA